MHRADNLFTHYFYDYLVSFHKNEDYVSLMGEADTQVMYRRLACWLRSHKRIVGVEGKENDLLEFIFPGLGRGLSGQAW